MYRVFSSTESLPVAPEVWPKSFAYGEEIGSVLNFKSVNIRNGMFVAGSKKAFKFKICVAIASSQLLHILLARPLSLHRVEKSGSHCGPSRVHS
jgi:hypothetical protein